MIKVYFEPQPNQFPPRGGVRTHLVKLYHHLSQQPEINLVTNPNDADILHVESAWRIPKTTTKKKTVFTCHGGFTPSPTIPNVVYNLENSDIIVSVSKWVADKFFPKYHNKTKIIYNGVDLEDFQKESDLILKDYILYAKEWDWYFKDFITLAKSRPELKFVTTIWPEHLPLLENVTYIGLQHQDKIINYLKNAACLILTGSEVCPTMLLEAWACKVPVLGKNIDGSKELMLKGNKHIGGYLYDKMEDVNLDYLIENKTKLGQDGFNEVSTKYLWKDLVRDYVDLYVSLLSKRN